MKNLKLTIATTLSILAIAFSGAASADGFDRHNKFKQNVYKQHVQKNKNMIVKSSQTNYKNRVLASNKKIVKTVVVKNTPNKKAVITKTIIKKPQKTTWYVKNNSVKNKKAVKQTVYSVRPGDTLIQVSFKTGVSVKQLARLNRIKHANLNNLRIGQILRLI